MKATAQTRRAASLVEVIRHGHGVTYRCKKCGHRKEASAYHEAAHKEMIRHADRCVETTKEEPSMTKDVELYGGGKALKHMIWRVKNCVPGGNRLQDHEAMSLAQVSLATGLDPFTGEIWYIPGKGPMAGIKGLRRRAREQSTYSVTLRAMGNGELEDHNIKLGDVGRICELFHHTVLQKAVEINKAAGEMVVPVKPILGVGIWRKGNQIASSKSSTWMADKRAEADALRRGFDLTELPYSDEVNGSQVDFAETAGNWSVMPEEEEVVRREVAHNAKRHAEVGEVTLTARERQDALDARAAQAQAAAEVPVATASSLNDAIARYTDSKQELPPWVEEIRGAVRDHPQASDPVGGNGSFVKQLEISAGRKVSVEQFRGFVEVVLTHPLEEITFGEASVLMNAINADGFEARVVSLLS